MEKGSETAAVRFPFLIFTPQNITKQFSHEDKIISADEYLDRFLNSKTETNEGDWYYNQRRKCLKKHFERRYCFKFSPITSDEGKLYDMNKLSSNDISDGYTDDLARFLEFVYSMCPVKKLRDRTEVNGKGEKIMETCILLL